MPSPSEQDDWGACTFFGGVCCTLRHLAAVIEGGQRHCNSEAYATPSDLSRSTTLSDEELAEEVRHKYEADRVGGHEWGNI
jgi:hypothetical protein